MSIMTIGEIRISEIANETAHSDEGGRGGSPIYICIGLKGSIAANNLARDVIPVRSYEILKKSRKRKFPMCS